MDKIIMQQNLLVELASLMLRKNQGKQLISLLHGMIEIKWKSILQLIKFLLRKKLLKFLLKEGMKHYWIIMKMERIPKEKFRNTKSNNKIIIMYLTSKIILKDSNKKNKIKIINLTAIITLRLMKMKTMMKKHRRMMKNLMIRKVVQTIRRKKNN